MQYNSAQDIKNRLTADDVDAFMCKALNAGPSREDGQGNRIFLTVDRHPEHPEEGSYKLYYYPETHSFYSFTGSEAYDIFSLVQAVKGFDFKQAYVYVCGFFNIPTREEGIIPPPPELTEDWDVLNKVSAYEKAGKEVETEHKELPPNIMDRFTKGYPQEWVDDGISPEAMEKYGIRIDVGAQKAIIPHHDDMGNIVGIRGRAFDPVEVAEFGKYAPIKIGDTWLNHELKKYLYGLYENKHTIQRLGKVCIAESEKACMQSATMFGCDNNFVVATCGSSGLSSEQIDLLLKYKVREVIIAYDKEFEDGNDEQMAKYEAKLLRLTQPLAPYFETYVIFDYDGLLGYKDSPFDKSKDVLLRLMKTKQPVYSISSDLAKRRKK